MNLPVPLTVRLYAARRDEEERLMHWTAGTKGLRDALRKIFLYRLCVTWLPYKTAVTFSMNPVDSSSKVQL